MANSIEQQFLQSLEWERFQQSLGSETFRAGESLFVVHTLPIVGRYAYSPRGPRATEQQATSDKQQVGWEEMLWEAKKRECSWIRIEPSSEEELHDIQSSATHYSLLTTHSPKDVQPREILVMDISKPEELLAEMKPKTRYNIRLAEKKGVKVIVSKEKKYQERFIELVRETAERAGIRPHTKEHYLKMFETLEGSVELYNAEYNGKVIAVNMMIFLEGGATYLHGGSSNNDRTVMSPFLLQWQAMRDAKEKGCKFYDFGGVATNNQQPTTNDAEKNVKCHSPRRTNAKCLEWKGITNFKQGFCPQTEATKFPGTWDIVLSPWRYWVYGTLTQVKKFLRK